MSRLEIRTSIIVVEEINLVNRSQYRSVYLNYRKCIVFWFNGSMIYKWVCGHDNAHFFVVYRCIWSNYPIYNRSLRPY